MRKLLANLVPMAAVLLIAGLAPRAAAAQLSGGRLAATAADGQTLTHPVAARGKLIYVSAETKPCVGVGPMTCLQVCEKPGDPWSLHYHGIEGFAPKSGIAYRLLIIEERVKNPPADAPSVRWVLDKIMEVRRVRQ